MGVDDFGRPVQIPAVRAQIAEALAAIPEGKRGALLILADASATRMHLAAKLGPHWKVAAGGGWNYRESKSSGYVGIEGSW
jgi:hypothetical protein